MADAKMNPTIHTSPGAERREGERERIVCRSLHDICLSVWTYGDNWQQQKECVCGWVEEMKLLFFSLSFLLQKSGFPPLFSLPPIVNMKCDGL